MSIKRWSCSLVPATLLWAGAASADPAAAPAKPAVPAAAAVSHNGHGHGRPALDTPPAAEGALNRRADAPGPTVAAAAREGAPGQARAYGERGNGVAAAAPGHAGPGHEDHEPGQGHADGPPRAAIEALMKAQSLSEEQAIAHLRARAVPRSQASQADLHRVHDTVRRERAKELRGRLKARGIPNALRAELRTHAKRIAQIERIRSLAGADAKLITRIDATLARENERHSRRMTRLVDEANQAPVEGAAPAEAAPASPAEATAAPAAPTAADNTAAAPAEAPKPTEQGATP
jgi:hypothetical protein